MPHPGQHLVHLGCNQHPQLEVGPSPSHRFPEDQGCPVRRVGCPVLKRPVRADDDQGSLTGTDYQVITARLRGNLFPEFLRGCGSGGEDPQVSPVGFKIVVVFRHG